MDPLKPLSIMFDKTACPSLPLLCEAPITAMDRGAKKASTDREYSWFGLEMISIRSSQHHSLELQETMSCGRSNPKSQFTNFKQIPNLNPQITNKPTPEGNGTTARFWSFDIVWSLGPPWRHPIKNLIKPWCFRGRSN
jgi:hypothetical protein